MDTGLNKEEQAKVQKQFSRQKNREYSRKFPLMSEKQLALKIISDWQSLRSFQKESLFKKYFPNQQRSKANLEDIDYSSSKKQTIRKKKQEYDRKYDLPQLVCQQDSDDDIEFQRVQKKIKHFYPTQINPYEQLKRKGLLNASSDQDLNQSNSNSEGDQIVKQKQLKKKIKRSDNL